MNPGDALTITKVDSHHSSRRRTNKTIVHMDFESTMENVANGREQIQDLRDKIEERESEVARLRCLLNTRDAEDTTPAIEELKRLQAAFDRSEAICEEKIDPIRKELSAVQAAYQSRQYLLQAMEDISRERQEFVEKVRSKTDTTFSQTVTPSYKPIDESQLLPILNEALNIKSDIDSAERSALFNNYKKRHLTKLNEQLARNLEEAIDNENKAQRKSETTKQNLEFKLSKPKTPVMDDKWFNAQAEYQRNLYRLKEANTRAKMLVEENNKLTTEYHQLVENVSKTREDLIALEKYIPKAGESSIKGNGATERSALTAMQIESDKLQAKIFVLKYQIAILQKIFENHQKQVSSFPSKLQTSDENLKKAKEIRKQVDADLDQVQEKEANLMAKNMFLADQEELMQKRLADHQSQLAETEKKIRTLELVLKKQEMIKKLNEEMYRLKCANLGRVAGTVSQVIEINSEIDKVPQN